MCTNPVNCTYFGRSAELSHSTKFLQFIWTAIYWHQTPPNIIINPGIRMFMAFWHVFCVPSETW